MTVSTVGVIGLGIMGSAISGRMMNQGIEVVGFDVDPVRRDAHQAQGGRVAASAADVAKETVHVITSLPNAKALEQTVADLLRFSEQIHPDLCLIEISTLSIADKCAARDHLVSIGRGMVDAPVSGTGYQATQGDLVVYLSGTAEDKAPCLDTLAAFSRAVYDTGDFGNGMRLKFIANHLVAIHNAAAAEALLLASRAGLDMDATLKALADGAGASRMLQVRGPLMIASTFDNPTMTVENFMKDLALIKGFSAAAGSPLPLFDVTAELYEIAMQRGFGNQDTASVFEVLSGLDDHI